MKTKSVSIRYTVCNWKSFAQLYRQSYENCMPYKSKIDDTMTI